MMPIPPGIWTSIIPSLSLIDIVESNGDTLDSMDFDIILDEQGNYQYTVSGTALLRFLADCYGHTRTDELKVKGKKCHSG